jgi:tight adherence protein C
MLPLIAVAAVVGCVFVVALTALLAGEERAEVRSSLRRLEGYQIESVREQEMLAPLRARIIAPVTRGMTQLTRRFTPQGYVEQIRHKLTLAGNPEDLDADRFLSFKVLGATSVIAWYFVFFHLLQLGGFYNMIGTALLGFASFIAPDAILRRRIDDRQHQIAVKLPDILDLLVISVEAGLGFEQAVDRTISAVPGPLSDEFGRMLQETRVGSSRADAMRALDERTDVPELRSFILAMLQADAFGVSIGRMLRAQADEMRIRRRQRAQEEAQKAPVKMLFPLIFCIFPSLFVVVLGPAAINIMKSL